MLTSFGRGVHCESCTRENLAFGMEGDEAFEENVEQLRTEGEMEGKGELQVEIGLKGEIGLMGEERDLILVCVLYGDLNSAKFTVEGDFEFKFKFEIKLEFESEESDTALS